MELRQPRRKRRVRAKCQQPFPIPIESFKEEVILNGVWRTYMGQYAGNNVVVNNPEDMTALHSMGFFGKGSLSRSAPTFGKWKMDTPPLIYNRQWKRRCDWAESWRSKISSVNVNTPVEHARKASDGGKELRPGEDASSNVMHVSGGIDNNVTSKSKIKSEMVEEDDDVVIECVITGEDGKPCEGSSGPSSNTKVQSSVQEKAETVNLSMTNSNDNDNTEVDVKQGQTVIVLADSDCDSGDEDYLLNLNPRLEQEEFPIQETLQLTLEEGFFLSYGLGCLQIQDIFGNELSSLELWKLFCESQQDFIEKYVVYHYFRSKGWIVKPGLKFGGDFLLYKQGPTFYHATYIVYIRVVSVAGMFESQNNRTLSWTQYIGLNRLSETAGKEVLLCNVVWPLNYTRSEIINSPKILSKFTVQEVLLRRWVSSQEREELENEDIME